MADVIRVYSVLADESLEDVKTLWSELVNSALFEEVGGRINGVLNETGVHKVLAHGFSHLSRHGESRRRGCGDDTGRLPWVGPTI